MTLTASGPSLRVRTRQLFEREQQFIAPGLQTIALLSELAIAEARGVFVTDLDGNRYLDFNAGVSAASLGHAHPEYVAALKPKPTTRKPAARKAAKKTPGKKSAKK